jgi:hypothetical protein
MAYDIKITMYRSDTGDWDLDRKEIMRPLTIDFESIKNEAIQLMIENSSNTCIIIKTSFKSNAKPGHWYIKGYKGLFSYKQLKTLIIKNIRENKYSSRECYLLKINY